MAAVLRISWSTRNRRGRRASAQSGSAIDASVELVSPFFIAAPERFALDGRVYLRSDDVNAAEAAVVALDGTRAPASCALRGLVIRVAIINESAFAGRGVGSCTNLSLSALAATDTPAPPRASAPPDALLHNVLPEIAGLVLILDFITLEEETALLNNIDESGIWTAQLSRRVAHLGATFDYVTKAPVAVGPSLPTTGPIAVAAEMISALGFVGDGGNSKLNLLKPKHSFQGIQGLTAALGKGQVWQRADGTPRSTCVVDQITVNEYLPGQGIAQHIDTHTGFQDGLVSLSLGSDIVMDLSRSQSSHEQQQQQQQQQPPHVELLVLPRRSLLILRGEARFAVAHSIAPRKTDSIGGVIIPRHRRLSITFRATRLTNAPCRCVWIADCEDQGGGRALAPLHSPRLREQEVLRGGGRDIVTSIVGGGHNDDGDGDEEEEESGDDDGEHNDETNAKDSNEMTCVAKTPSIESSNVHALYDAIAPHFSSTRHSPWPRVAAYVSALPVGTILVDIGCGNGKYLPGAKAARVMGVGFDRSAPLVEIAAARGFEAGVCDALLVPVRGGSADTALSIAVLHHLSTRARRVAALVELLRVVKPHGGQALVYAWALEQGAGSRRAFATQDVLVPWALKRHFVDANAPLPAGAVVDDERGVVVMQRFCHVYVHGELETLFEEAAASLGARFMGLVEGEEEEETGLRESGEEGSDILTARVIAVAKECNRGVAEVVEAGCLSTIIDGGKIKTPVVRLKASWYESDNHCVLVQRGVE